VHVGERILVFFFALVRNLAISKQLPLAMSRKIMSCTKTPNRLMGRWKLAESDLGALLL
jgi:hypothetical protein